MSPGTRRALKSFLTDALRMSSQALDMLRELVELAEQESISPARVTSLFQIVHTLKGTATMVYGGERVVESLQALESHLACRPVHESALELEWLELARTSLTQARDALQELDRKEKMPSSTMIDEPNAKGLLARVALDAQKSALLWFPVRSLIRVFPGEQVQGRQVLSLDGTFVPVLAPGAPESAAGPRFGLGVQLEAGKAVLAIQEFGGFVTWDDAVKVGAVAGLEFTGAKRSA